MAIEKGHEDIGEVDCVQVDRIRVGIADSKEWPIGILFDSGENEIGPFVMPINRAMDLRDALARMINDYVSENN